MKNPPLIQVHGYAPHQFVFGRNPHIPEDLLSEPLSIVPATVTPLTEDSLAKSQAMRTTARVALMKLQDDRALVCRCLPVLAAALTLNPAMDVVAYRRDQKWIQCKSQLGGRWYGPADAVGHVGRNVVISHCKQLLRCAPEQTRPCTDDERQLFDTPKTKLLGIKHLLDSGGFKSHNYVDLVSQSYPHIPKLSDEQKHDMASQLQQPDPLQALVPTPSAESPPEHAPEFSPPLLVLSMDD